MTGDAGIDAAELLTIQCREIEHRLSALRTKHDEAAVASLADAVTRHEAVLRNVVEPALDSQVAEPGSPTEPSTASAEVLEERAQAAIEHLPGLLRQLRRLGSDLNEELGRRMTEMTVERFDRVPHSQLGGATGADQPPDLARPTDAAEGRDTE